jgi:hypothetical protein
MQKLTLRLGPTDRTRLRVEPPEYVPERQTAQVERLKARGGDHSPLVLPVWTVLAWGPAEGPWFQWPSWVEKGQVKNPKTQGAEVRQVQAEVGVLLGVEAGLQRV